MSFLSLEVDILWDCIVVGAGIEGSNAARCAASFGKKTLCLEQFPIPHNRGSSHGQSRVTRHSYDQKYYADMMPDAFSLWEEIEQQANDKLFINCGYMTLDSPPYAFINTVQNNLEANGIKAEHVSNNVLKETFHLNYPHNVKGLLERTGGILLANKCLAAVRTQFEKFGGFLKDNEKVIEIVPGDIVSVRTDKDLYRTRTVILTPGPWAGPLLKSLGVDIPLRTVRAVNLYWKVRQRGFGARDKYPCFFDNTPESIDKFNGFIYGLPCYEYPALIKICFHGGLPVDPDARDDVDDTWVINVVAEFVRNHMIGVESKPSIVEPCIYTVSPDKDCILDKHPNFPNIVFGVGFSGSGFKISPVVGKILFQLAFDLQPTYDMEPFKLSRFQKPSLKSSL